MNKKDLIEKLNKKYPELGEPLVERVVNLFFRNIAEALKRDYRIEIRNFGVFKLKKLDERKLFDPKTGKYVEIASKNIPFFKCSKKLHKIS
ncbi:MAG: integration host factor subunit beta [Rickettsiales bacterium]|nr:integration host factor subunit beta [Rickettsiales bacterium]